MSLGLYATGIAILIGLTIGSTMGYFAGGVDLIGMRLIEVFEAIPTLFLMLTLVALFPGESYRFPMLMAVIGVTGWTGYARYVRAEFLRLRTADFVHAAVAAGLPTPAVIFRHMLPNGVTPVVITASFGVAGAVIAESTLSYLGLGTVDQPSWGGLLAQSLGQGGQSCGGWPCSPGSLSSSPCWRTTCSARPWPTPWTPSGREPPMRKVKWVFFGYLAAVAALAVGIAVAFDAAPPRDPGTFYAPTRRRSARSTRPRSATPRGPTSARTCSRPCTTTGTARPTRTRSCPSWRRACRPCRRTG